MRIARPTNCFEEVIQFYQEGLGLEELGTFSGHRGYNGVMFGLPGTEHHLEFTQHVDGSPCPAPTKDNLLVFYIPDAREIEQIMGKLAEMGYPEVPPENPYWQAKGKTVEDPDGWRIVLMHNGGDMKGISQAARVLTELRYAKWLNSLIMKF